MTDVKRYTPIVVFEGVREPYAELDQCSLGQAVKFTDYQALQAENERLQFAMGLYALPPGLTQEEKRDHILNHADRKINKIKADSVREAMDNLLMNGGYGMSFSDAVAALEEYATKLEAGE